MECIGADLYARAYFSQFSGLFQHDDGEILSGQGQGCGRLVRRLRLGGQVVAGTVTDTLLDGCYVAFSARRNSSNTTADGSKRVMTISSSAPESSKTPTKAGRPDALSRPS